jgi:hypothetical protein
MDHVISNLSTGANGSIMQDAILFTAAIGYVVVSLSHDLAWILSGYTTCKLFAHLLSRIITIQVN